MAGEDLDLVWRDLYLWNGNLVVEGRPVTRRNGTVCPARGCHGCTNPECMYSEFIQRYWGHPQCD